MVRDGLVAADEPGRLAALLAGAAHVHVVTVTMYPPREAAYTADGDLPALLVASRPSVSDRWSTAARGGRSAGSVGGGVRQRARRRSAAPRPVRRPGPGGRTGRRRRGADHRWAFPLSVVDRVVPSVDEASEPDVVADATFRWVLKDALAGPRPAWEAGRCAPRRRRRSVQLAKLHLVNAPHSLLAYLGATRGHTTVADAMGDPLVGAAVAAMLRDELVGCVPAAPGLDPGAEAATTVRRFADRCVPHALTQVAAEGPPSSRSGWRCRSDAIALGESAEPGRPRWRGPVGQRRRPGRVEDSCADRGPGEPPGPRRRSGRAT